MPIHWSCNGIRVNLAKFGFTVKRQDYSGAINIELFFKLKASCRYKNQNTMIQKYENTHNIA